jgi:hypothetical protein
MIQFLRKLYKLWRFDKDMNRLFNVWYYLLGRDTAAWEIVDVVLHRALLEREGI